jgi:hypothetical protein
MYPRTCFFILAAGLSALPAVGVAATPPGRAAAVAPKAAIARMTAPEPNRDAKPGREATGDESLLRLFDGIDGDVDVEEPCDALIALADWLTGEEPIGRRWRHGFRGRGGFGPGAPGLLRQPGQILPPRLQERLNLTEAQARQLEELQREVDARLSKILTEEQRRQLAEMRPRGPGGPGSFGGPEGFGPPGGRRGFGCPGGME